jgi:predicted lipoprotein with Yx(FWY)xxD motif
MADLTREEERKGWRRLFLWAIPIALGAGVLLMLGPTLVNEYAPERTGEDRVETREAHDGVQPTKPEGPATIQVKHSNRFGDHLSDGFGRALYIFQKDGQGRAGTSAASECYEECANSWPPLRTEGAPKPSAGVDGALLGTTERKDGTAQVTYNGWPLYLFVRDVGPEEGTGHHLQDFGGEWYLVSPKGETVRGQS